MALQLGRVRSIPFSVFAAASLVVALGACGSDAATSSSPTNITSPEQHIADDAAVTAGLGRMTATAAAISATVASGTTVDDAQDQLEVDWKQVEGTFRQNEPDLYLSVEEALNGIEQSASAANAAGTARFVTDLTTATTAYLAKHS